MRTGQVSSNCRASADDRCEISGLRKPGGPAIQSNALESRARSRRVLQFAASTTTLPPTALPFWRNGIRAHRVRDHFLVAIGVEGHLTDDEDSPDLDQLAHAHDGIAGRGLAQKIDV